jgi:nucleoside-diphosphate-sugar epimerase
MPHTLVTGANGFVASHVVDALITRGHTVTGSLRDKNKGSGILQLHPEWEGKLDFVSVTDYAKEGVWDAIFEDGDFDYVVHVAAPVLDDPRNTDFERDYVIPSIRG